MIHIFQSSPVKIILLWALLFTGFNAFAVKGTATVSGNWNTASTWSFNGTRRIPACGDSLLIPAEITVTVSNQINYQSCSADFIVDVYGILQFTNGNKLDFTCNSIVYVHTGGLIKKSTPGGGSSTLITICNVVQWKAGDGTLNGPDTLIYVSPLPVELISFEAHPDGNTVALSWVTASEINNDYFTLERSQNGLDFTVFQSLPGAGNSTGTLNYNSTDETPFDGLTYYRLRQTDFDGTFAYSDIVTVNRSSKYNFAILSASINPDTGVQIKFSKPGAGYCSLQLTDLQGNVLIDQLYEVHAGINNLSIYIPSAPAGIYSLTLSDEAQSLSGKIMGF